MTIDSFYTRLAYMLIENDSDSLDLLSHRILDIKKVGSNPDDSNTQRLVITMMDDTVYHLTLEKKN